MKYATQCKLNYKLIDIFHKKVLTSSGKPLTLQSDKNAWIYYYIFLVLFKATQSY